MMTDDDSQALEGEIVGPEGDGEWLPLTVAQPLLGIAQKTLYRRAERGQIPSRKNAEGRIEVWVEKPKAEERRLSPTVGLNVVDVHELLAPLAQALTDSQRQSEANLERALLAEAELARLRERLSGREPGRIEALRSWWRFWIRGETGDSQ